MKLPVNYIKRYLYTLSRFTGLMTAGQLTRRGRRTAKEVAAALGWGRLRTALPQIEIDEIAPDTEPLYLRSISHQTYNTSFHELYVLARLTRALQPSTIFEIGTFDGRTTLNLTANAPPDAQVFTLDLPPGQEKFGTRTRTGIRFHDTPYAVRINQLLGDTFQFDFSPWAGRINLVFVDAGHAYENVVNDTRAAMSMVDVARGAIVWHDYSTHRGVQRALDEFYGRGGAYRAMCSIKDTSMAILLLGEYTEMNAELKADKHDLEAAENGAAYTPRWRFDELKQSYNFRHPSERADLMIDLIAEEAARHTRPVKAVDIGCGHGIALDQVATSMMRRFVDEFWGVEPDEHISPPAGVFDNFQHATIEDAQLPPESFDLAYSSLVMEHVQQPVEFFRAVHRALKPGGTYLFLTINGLHYFARSTSLLKSMRLDELTLRLLRGSAVEEYHYPVAYRCNKPRDIERICRETGFERPEFVFVERHGPAPYFPGPMKLVLHAMTLKRSVVRNPMALLDLIGRVRKPSS